MGGQREGRVVGLKKWKNIGLRGGKIGELRKERIEGLRERRVIGIKIWVFWGQRKGKVVV